MVPYWKSPRFHDRRPAERQAARERFEPIAGDDLAPCFGGDHLQQFLVWLEPSELVGFGLRCPADLALADETAIGGIRRHDAAINAWSPRYKGGVVLSGIAFGGIEGQGNDGLIGLSHADRDGGI